MSESSGKKRKQPNEEETEKTQGKTPVKKLKQCYVPIMTIASSVTEALTNAEKCAGLIKFLVDKTSVSSDHLKVLSQYVINLRDAKHLMSVGIPNLQMLIKIMTGIMKKGIVADMNTEGEVQKSCYKWDVSQAVLVCLNIFTSDDMPFILMEEDTVNDIFVFIKCKLCEFNIDAGKKTNKQVPAYWQSSESVLNKNLKLIIEFVSMRQVNSVHMHSLLTACLGNILMLNNRLAKNLQITCLLLVLMVFQKLEEHRSFILTEILVVLSKVPENFKFSVMCETEEGEKLTTVCALVMGLVQCCGARVSCLPNDQQATARAQSILQEGYQAAMTFTGALVMLLVNHCHSSKENHKLFRGLLDSLVTDLLPVSNLPEWPAADFLLQLLKKPLAEIIISSKDQYIKVFAVKQLFKMAVKVKEDSMNLSHSITDKIVAFRRDFEYLCDSDIAVMILASYLRKTPLPDIAGNALGLRQTLWFDYFKHGADFEPKKMLVINAFTSTSGAGHCDSREQAVAAAQYIASTRYNYTSFTTYLNYILKSCLDKSKKVKTIGAQCLADLIKMDQSLLASTTVAKTMRECLVTASAAGRDAICGLIGQFLLTNIDKAAEYTPYLLHLLDDDTITVKRTCIVAVQALIRVHVDFPMKNDLCYKILSLVQDQEATIQKQVVEFCSALWLDPVAVKTNFKTLLELVERTDSVKWLRQLLEEKLKPEMVGIMEDTQSQPASQVVDSCEMLIAALVQHMKKVNANLASIQILSIFSIIYPKALTKHLEAFARPLLSTGYSQDFGKEQLLAETINNMLRDMRNPKVHLLSTVHCTLMKKLLSNESLNFTMGLIISLIKLEQGLSAWVVGDPLEDCFRMNLEVLTTFKATGKTADERVLIRALCIVVYLLKDHNKPGDDSNAIATVEHFLKHPKYVLSTIHAMCYLSIDYKPIMTNPALREVVQKYLKDRSTPVLTQAVLHNISCALKNVKEMHGDPNIKKMDEMNTEVVSGLLQEHCGALLQCALDEKTAIRHTACLVLSQVVRCGLMMESRFLPYIVSMSADAEPNIAAMGRELLKRIQLRKTVDISRNCQQGLLMSHSVHFKLSETGFARGFVEVNGELQARNEHLYELIRDNVRQRRQMIDGVLHELCVETNRAVSEAIFLVDQLALFPYKYTDEVLYLLRRVEHVISNVTLPEALPSNPPDSLGFVLRHYSLYLLEPLRTFLQKRYGVSDVRVEKYYSETPSKDKASNHASVKFEIPRDRLPPFHAQDGFAKAMFSSLKKMEKLESSRLSSSSSDRPLSSFVKAAKTPVPKSAKQTPKTTPKRKVDSNNNNAEKISKSAKPKSTSGTRGQKRDGGPTPRTGEHCATPQSRPARKKTPSRLSFTDQNQTPE